MDRPLPELVATTFRELRRVSPIEREARLAALSGEDVRLRDEVLSLLRYDGDDDDASAGLGLGLADLPINEVGLEIPEQIGPFEIIGILGSGGTAHVYLARQRHPDRHIALKVLRGDCSTPWIAQRFVREGRLLATLKHPGIAQVYATSDCASDADSVAYLAMELVNGPTLLRFADDKQLDRRARVKLLIDACVAIAHAHQVGIIHRDLKPANILVDISSPEPRVKVLDFGIGRVIPGSGIEATRTEHTSQIIGTMAYMSPERFDVESAVDIRSDVYALGVIGYELLLGCRPHDLEGLPPLLAIKRIADTPPTEPRTIDATIEGDLALILTKAIARERADRYESVAALRDDLQAFLEHRPIRARRPSQWYLTKRFVRRNRMLSGVIATGALGVAAALAGMNLALSESRKSERAAHAATTELRATVGELRDEWQQLVRAATVPADTFDDCSEVRLNLLVRLRDRYAYLIERDGANRVLREDYARLLRILGERFLEVGDGRAATGCFTAATLFLTQMLRENPTRADLYHEFGTVDWRSGEAAALRGLDAKAVIHGYESAHGLFVDAEARWPRSPVALSDLACSHLRLGRVALERGDHAEAGRGLAAAELLATRLHVVAPEQRTALRCESLCDQLRYQIAVARADFQSAFDAAERWSASTDRLRTSFPLDPLSFELCMFAAAAQAEAAQQLGDCTAAHESMIAAIGVADFLVAALPNNQRYAQARLQFLLQATDLALRTAQGDQATIHAERFGCLSDEFAIREWKSDAQLARVALLQETLHSIRDCCSPLPTLSSPTPANVNR